MGLKAKFNLVMLAAFVVGLGLAAGLSWRIAQDNARREVLQQATLMMAMASAIRDYTAKEIEPLLANQIKVRFLPHTVPSWAAQTKSARAGRKLARLHVQGSRAEPNQSRRPLYRLGKQHHRLLRS